MAFHPCYLTTHLGSLPHADGKAICERIVSTLDIPAWPQLPRRSFRENMYTQYSPSLPAIGLDEASGMLAFCARRDLASALDQFEAVCRAEDLERFGLRAEFAAGFFQMLEVLRKTPGEFVKGQVTGPISFGLTVTGQNLRASLYDERLAEVIVQNMAMNARWQVRQLRAARPQVMIFVDEPYLASFGSAYIRLSCERVVAILDEVFAAIHAEGALAGIHCCANTDWSVLLATQADILSFDAFTCLEALAHYPADLRAFLDQGGCVAWGLVPNDAEIFQATPTLLAQRLRKGLELIYQHARARGISLRAEEFAARSLLTPICGLGAASPAVADCVLDMLVQTGEILKRG